MGPEADCQLLRHRAKKLPFRNGGCRTTGSSASVTKNHSVFRRFRRWSQKGIWWRMFAAMSDDPDFEYLIVDATIIRAHQHAAGAKKGLKIKPLAALAAA